MSFLTIRPEQFHALSQAREDVFFDNLETHVRTHFPACADDTLREHLTEQVAAARALGLTVAADLFRYISLPCTLGFDFEGQEENAWVKEGLRDASVPEPEQRLARVLARLKKELNRRAAAASARAAFEAE